MKRIKTFLLKSFYFIVYDPLYSFYYSLKEIWAEVCDLARELKKPRTWSSLLYIACFYAFLKRDVVLFKRIVPFIIVVYIIRQRIDGKYRAEIRRKAILKNNDVLLMEEYKKYKRECYFTKQIALEYEQWKEREIRQLKNG